MNPSDQLRTYLRNGAIGIGLFLFGALLAFGYSYRPLHGALAWKVEQLETRLDERNIELLSLREEIERRDAEDVERIDPAQFAELESELRSVRSSLIQVEGELERTDQQRREANTSAQRWRKRFEKLRDQPKPSQIAIAPAPTPEPTPPAAIALPVAELRPDDREPVSQEFAPDPPSNSPGPSAAAARDAEADSFAPVPSPVSSEGGMLPDGDLVGPEIP